MRLDAQKRHTGKRHHHQNNDHESTIHQYKTYKPVYK